MECLLPHLCMVTVPHIMVGLERMLDYKGVGLARFHCILWILLLHILLISGWLCYYIVGATPNSLGLMIPHALIHDA